LIISYSSVYYYSLVKMTTHFEKLKLKTKFGDFLVEGLWNWSKQDDRLLTGVEIRQLR